MSGAEIRALLEKLTLGAVVAAQAQRTYFLPLRFDQLAYLAGLLRSHLLWREWLTPGE